MYQKKKVRDLETEKDYVKFDQVEVNTKVILVTTQFQRIKVNLHVLFTFIYTLSEKKRKSSFYKEVFVLSNFVIFS